MKPPHFRRLLRLTAHCVGEALEAADHCPAARFSTPESLLPIRIELIDEGRLDLHVTQFSRKDEIATVGKVNNRCPFEGQPYLTRVVPRRVMRNAQVLTHP